MKGVLEVNIGFLIFLIAVIAVIAVMFMLLTGISSKENLSRGCTGVIDSIISSIKGSMSSSDRSNFPNAIWC